VVPLALTNLLRQFAVSSHCSLFVLLLAAYRLLMYRLGAGHDILIVTPVSCRQHHQLQPMVGLLMNMLVLRESLQPTESFLQLLARLKTNTLADFEQQHYCYEDVLALLAQSSAADQAAPLAFCFVLHNQDVAQTAGELLAEVKLDSGVAEFALTLYCREQDGELQLTFEYASSLFSARRIASLSQIFLALLAQLVQQPATSLIELELHIEPDSPWQSHAVMPVSP
jgi:non-ribosomal peptide synthetase component F